MPLRSRWLPVLSLLAAAGTAAGAPEVLEVFVREGCPRCAEAKVFVAELQREQPGLEVRYHDVQRDPSALTRLEELAAAQGFTSAGVPSFYGRGRLLIGFDAGRTPQQLRELLAGAPVPAEPGATCAAEEAVCAEEGGEEIDLPLFGRMSARKVGLPLFTLAIGLVDGFNPCAMWVLLFILSMLVSVHSRARMFAIGGTFVFVAGAIYFFFLAAWLNLFLVLRFTRPVQIALGVFALGMSALQLKEAVGVRGGPSLSIPESAKPGIYARVRRLVQERSLLPAIAGAAVLSGLVNLVELLCTAGLPALYTHVLAARALPAWQYYGYLCLYCAAYILDDSIMLGIAVVTLSRRKLQQRGGRLLKLLSGAAMAGLALLLLFRPAWLTF